MKRLPIKEIEKQIFQLQEENEALRNQAAELRHSEAALRDSDARFRRFFFDSPDAMAISRMEDGLFSEINDGFTEVTGYSREEVIGKTSLELNIVTDPEDRARLIAALKEGGRVRNFEVRFRMKDGSILTGLTSATAFTLDGVPHILTTHRLIEGIKQVERELRQQAKQLAAVYRLARKTGMTLNREQVTDAALACVTDVIDTAIVLLFLRQEDTLLHQGFRAQDPRYGPDEQTVHRVGECLCGLAAKGGKAVYSEDIRRDPRCTWTECKKAGLISFAALPLTVRDQVIGVLGLGSNTRRDFKTESDFLEALSGQVALGLQNALLFEELQKHSNALERRVGERTAELEEKNREMERFNRVMVGRELKMIALKEKIRGLEKELAAKG